MDLQILKAKPWIVPLAGFFISILLALLATSSNSTVQKDDPLGIDTYIPKGYVLVPIEVQNHESLDSVIGQYGVVDLYLTSDLKSQKSRPVAKAVKLLRAPKNPSQFGVLVPEDQAPSLVVESLPFYVVVQRPDRGGTTFEKVRSKPHSRVVYEEDFNDVDHN